MSFDESVQRLIKPPGFRIRRLEDFHVTISPLQSKVRSIGRMRRLNVGYLSFRFQDIFSEVKLDKASARGVSVSKRTHLDTQF